ncbi:MAG: hypothetical protein HQL76_03045, partial [Magnetococcales bacterium]|nr:hypothetical protein [Magnetococcales bacterium]
AKALAEKEAKALVEKEAKALAEKEAKALAEKEAKALAEKEAKLAAEKEAKVLAEKEAKLAAEKEAKEGAIRKAPLSFVSLMPLRVEPLPFGVKKLEDSREVVGTSIFQPRKVAIVRHWQMPYTMIPDEHDGTEVGFSITAPDDQWVRFSMARMMGRTVFCEGEQFDLSPENLSEMALFVQIVPREAFMVAFEGDGTVKIPRSFWDQVVQAHGKWVTVSRILRQSDGGTYFIRDVASKKILDIQAELEK